MGSACTICTNKTFHDIPKSNFDYFSHIIMEKRQFRREFTRFCTRLLVTFYNCRIELSFSFKMIPNWLLCGVPIVLYTQKKQTCRFFGWKKPQTHIKGIRYSRHPQLIFRRNFYSKSILVCSFQICKEKYTIMCSFSRY